MISKIRKPDVEEVSAFDDQYSGLAFRQAEDPYAGKSFAEVLRMKREALEKNLAEANLAKANAAAAAEAQAQAQAQAAQQQPAA